MPFVTAKSGVSENAIFEILTRLWQIKSRGVEIMERWSEAARDSDVRAGLPAQIADDRRHLRLLTDELRRRGSRQPTSVDHVVTKAFTLVQAQPTDALKVCAFHRGIKATTRERTYRLLSYVDGALGEVLERIIHDDDRHLRWADMRLQGLSGGDVRRCNALLEKVGGAMEAVWSRPWRHFSTSKLSYLGRQRTGSR